MIMLPNPQKYFKIVIMNESVWKHLLLKSLFVSGFHIKRSFANDISFTGEVAFKIVESSGLKLVDALAFFAINSWIPEMLSSDALFVWLACHFSRSVSEYG